MMTPLPSSVASLALYSRDIEINNPLKDPEFIRTLAGCIAAGVTFLVLIFVLLLFYRDASLFDTCRGRRNAEAKSKARAKATDLEAVPSPDSSVLSLPKLHPTKPS
jgi:hypothetical protein